MTKEKKAYDALLPLIPKGKENGIPRQKLAETLRISPRDVSSLVLMARRDSIVICSDNHGYYFPRDNNEMHDFYKTSQKRAITILDSLTPARRVLKKAGFFERKEKDGL